MNTRIDIVQGPISLKRLSVLRDVDATVHDLLVDALPSLSEHLEGEADLASLADLAAQIATETPQAAQAFADRISSEPSLVQDYVGLRRWVVHALQKHRHDIKRMLQHFERGNPSAFSDEQAESDSSLLQNESGILLHYLAGFGFEDFSIDLHEPEVQRRSATIEDGVVRLPRRLDVNEGESRERLLRATFAHVAAHLRYSPLHRSAGNRRPSLLTMTALVEDARIERLMIQEYPGLASLWRGFHTATRESSGYDFAGLTARLSRALHDRDYDDTNAWVRKGRELFEEAAGQDLHDVGAFDRLARTLAIDLGKMRLGPAKNYRPEPSYRDDNTVLWGPDEALPEDTERHVETEIVESLKDDEKSDPVVADIDVRRRFRYPEWDNRLGSIREGWTTVIEEDHRLHKAARRIPSSSVRINLLASERIPDRSIRLTRLPEGDDLDLNVAVDNIVEQRSGITPDGRIFCRHGRRRRSTAVILLMDLSISTDRFVPGSFTRVIDVEKQAALVIAEAMEAQHDRIAVHGFTSNGRNDVSYRRIKDFDEPFGDYQRAKLAELESQHSTRMGAALRHATATLAREDADHKVVLILTDGEPSDIDVLEDDYLVEDAREAVVSAMSQRVRTFCVTLDRRADHYARRIFGERNYLIAERASTFANNTNKTLTRLLAL